RDASLGVMGLLINEAAVRAAVASLRAAGAVARGLGLREQRLDFLRVEMVALSAELAADLGASVQHCCPGLLAAERSQHRRDALARTRAYEAQGTPAEDLDAFFVEQPVEQGGCRKLQQLSRAERVEQQAGPVPAVLVAFVAGQLLQQQAGGAAVVRRQQDPGRELLGLA